MTNLHGFAAGVPYTAIAPEHTTGNSPLVVIWHLLDAPRTDSAMAAALPLAGLNAWRVYLGLPMTGSRTPEGGWEPLFDDVVMKIYDPITRQAAEEFPAALAQLRREFTEGPLALVGGSLGAAIALEAISPEVSAVALVNPVIQLANVVAAGSRAFGMTYEWNEESTAVAQRLDFVNRAKEIDVPLLIVSGDQDRQGGLPGAGGQALAGAAGGQGLDGQRAGPGPRARGGAGNGTRAANGACGAGRRHRLAMACQAAICLVQSGWSW